MSLLRLLMWSLVALLAALLAAACGGSSSSDAGVPPCDGTEQWPDPCAAGARNMDGGRR